MAIAEVEGAVNTQVGRGLAERRARKNIGANWCELVRTRGRTGRLNVA
jgi:hypothetical protein